MDTDLKGVNGAETEESVKKQAVTGVPYCVEDILTSLSTIDKIVDQQGTAAIITKEDISAATSKKTNTLVLYFSTYQQYGILDKVHGKGFLPSNIYKKYRDKIYPHDERQALLEMFKRPPLYNKIIENLNNTQLPSEEKFPALLKGEPYNVNANSAERAARIFFENIRKLKLLSANNKFILSTDIKPDEIKKDDKHEDHKPQSSSRTQRTDLVELPIHLPGEGDRTVYFQYPKDLTKRDFKVIAKGLTFIASSIIVDETNENYEITVKVEEQTNPK